LRVSRVRNSPWCHPRHRHAGIGRYDDGGAVQHLEDRSGADAQTRVNQYIRSLKPGELVVLCRTDRPSATSCPATAGCTRRVVVVRALLPARTALLTLGRLSCLNAGAGAAAVLLRR
jgi:antitoxin (DNA-binding transcriptional repressor) of toxin-antitoxin stability system